MAELELTKSNLITFVIKWDIDRFILQTREKFYSPVFKNVSSGNGWRLYIEVTEKDSKKYHGIFLKLQSSRNVEVSAKFSIQILYSDGRVFKEFKINEFHTFTRKSPNWGWRDFITSDELLKVSGPLGDDDVLHIQYSIQEIYEIKEEDTDLILTMKDQFKDMYSNQIFCDVSLVVGGQMVMAHKVILAAASPVFMSMFNSDKTKKKVVIKDLSYDALKALVDSIYGKPVDESILDEVLIAANKYKIKSIKEDCITKLIAGLNDENAAECVVLGDKHDAKRLKINAAKYIARK